MQPSHPEGIKRVEGGGTSLWWNPAVYPHSPHSLESYLTVLAPPAIAPKNFRCLGVSGFP